MATSFKKFVYVMEHCKSRKDEFHAINGLKQMIEFAKDDPATQKEHGSYIMDCVMYCQEKGFEINR